MGSVMMALLSPFLPNSITRYTNSVTLYPNLITRYTNSITRFEKWSLIFQRFQPPDFLRTISTLSTFKRIGLNAGAEAMLYNDSGALDLRPRIFLLKAIRTRNQRP